MEVFAGRKKGRLSWCWVVIPAKRFVIGELTPRDVRVRNKKTQIGCFKNWVMENTFGHDGLLGLGVIGSVPRWFALLGGHLLLRMRNRLFWNSVSTS